jgi:rhodanese-related sulfurtransferase
MFNKLFQMGPDPREITNADAAKVYEGKNATFVDVREMSEWNAGHMPGSVHIPLGDLTRRAGELPTDKPIITVCRSGNRSLYAVDMLQTKGHSDVKSMAGGLVEWASAGRPLE